MTEPDADDSSLLRDYCASRDEEAFRTLVERHLPAVWSAARRMVNDDAALADDIAQEVFAHLAAYAPKLPPRVVLGGWLHRHTCFTAKKALRSAARRRARELHHAAAMTAASTADPWPDIAPHLDAALNALPAADRDAVVLRFFEKRDFRTIAATLGTSEDAARMRTARALEKLRGLLGKRSALLTVALLTSLLTDKSVAAPPANFTAQVVQYSLARAAAPAVSTLTALLLRLRPLHAALIGGAVLCAAGFFVWQWHSGLSLLGESSRRIAPPLAAATDQATPPLPGALEAAVHLFVVPEAEAVALLANRWNSADDGVMLEKLLKKSGLNSSVPPPRILTGSCQPNSATTRLAKGKEFSYPESFVEPDSGAGGKIAVEDYASKTVGSVAELRVSRLEGSEGYDVMLSVEHDFAAPVMCHFRSSLANTEDESLPGAEQPEFRTAKTVANLLLQPGEPQLASSNQLPLLPEVPAGDAGQRLFTFITLTPSAHP